MLKFCVFVYGPLSLRGYQRNVKVITVSLQCKFCKTLRAMVSLMGRAIFETFWTSKDNSVSGYTGGKCIPMYINSK